MGNNIDILYQNHFDRLKDFYSNLIKENKIDGIVIHSGIAEEYFDDDQPKPFRAYGNFKHWIPYNESDSFLLIKPDETPVLYYHIYNDFWYEPKSSLESYWTDYFTLKVINNTEDIFKSINKPENTVYLGSEVELVKIFGIKDKNINPDRITLPIKYFRRIKDEYEVYCTNKATEIAYKGHKKALELFHQGFSEFDIHMGYLKACGLFEYETPYPNIIAINNKSSFLHYDTKRVNKPDDYYSFLIDAGAVYESYTSDVTRTHVSKVHQHSVFHDLILRIESVQKNIISSIKIGLSFIELHELTHRLLAEVLADFKIVNLSSDEIFNKGISRYFLPHGLGHLMGVQVHDVGGYIKNKDGEYLYPPKEYEFLRLTQRIEDGHLFTIEPGIYFNDKLMGMLNDNYPNESNRIDWNLINELKKFGGIRIEDNVFVKKDSILNITRSVFDF